jgi:hypothetical protein
MMRYAHEDAWAAGAEPAYVGRDAIAIEPIALPDAPAHPGRRRHKTPAPLRLVGQSGEPQAPPTSTTATGAANVVEPMPPELLACLAPSPAGEPALWNAARSCLRGLPVATLRRTLKSPMLRDGLARLVPLLKVSDVIPCLEGPGMVELVLPWLDRSQCRLLGPEVAALIAPALHLNWAQLGHLPLETVVLVPTEAFWVLPVQVLKQLPEAHRHYVAPYVKRVRKLSHDHHDLALCRGLSEILHLYTHKVLDPEHIPDVTQLRAVLRDGSLRAKIRELRWLADAVMSPAVEAVQIGSLKLTTLIIALRKVGLAGLAGALELSLRLNRRARGYLCGADGVAYTRDGATAVQHSHVEPDALPGAIYRRHTDGRYRR